LADKVLNEHVAGVAVGDVVLLQNFIGQVGAGLERQLLGEDQGIVAVEEDLCNLQSG
jgi:hypothetical protein